MWGLVVIQPQGGGHTRVSNYLQGGLPPGGMSAVNVLLHPLTNFLFQCELNINRQE